MLLNKVPLREALIRKERVLPMSLNDWTRKKFFAGAVLFALAAAAAAPGLTRAEANDPLKSADIVDTAVGAGQFKTLAAALEAAGLIDELKGAGPFTVFAPTDEAFAKLPAGTVESLLKPENKEKLKSILLYHVVSGNVPASKVVKLNGRSVKTLEGSSIKVRANNGVRVGNASVVQTDVMASNGVIHVIDTVLMPVTAAKAH
jgi:uncharacterized surface protein with fasciclin (FAS1) repeats